MLINFMWPLLPQMHQFCLFTRPFIWKVAATVYITHYKKLSSSTTLSIKFSNSTLVYWSVSSISHKIWILKAQNLVQDILGCHFWYTHLQTLISNTTSSDYNDMAVLCIQHNFLMCTAVQMVCDFPHFTFLKLVKAVLNSSAEDFFHMHATNCDALLQNSCFWPTELLIYTVLLLHTCHQSDRGKSSVYDSWKHIMHIHAVCTRRCMCTFKKTIQWRHNGKSHLHVFLLIKAIMFETRSIIFWFIITAYKNAALYNTRHNRQMCRYDRIIEINSTINNIKPSYIVLQCWRLIVHR
jgi:hypothetical protein